MSYPSLMVKTEVLVVGGGVVGSAIGYGIARLGPKVLVLDGEDNISTPSRSNGGLVWVQTKGDGVPQYQSWTLRSADLWQDLANELKDQSGVDVHLRQSGGLVYCLGDEELAIRRDTVERMNRQGDANLYGTRILDRHQLQSIVPGRLGDDVTGGSFCPRDGDVNPLKLLNALQKGITARGSRYQPGCLVTRIVRDGDGFVVSTTIGEIAAGKIVIAAGNATGALAAQLDMHVPTIPLRGQQLITERISPVLAHPGLALRQTEEGTCMIGGMKENAGFNDAATASAAAKIVGRAVRIIPALRDVRAVRWWGGIRVMSPDGAPIYMQSQTHPNAFSAICHSGVTLTAAHAFDLAAAVVAGALPAHFAPFHSRRFAPAPPN